MLSSEHLSLRGEHPKFFPKFVGPFKIAALRGVNTVELSIPRRSQFSLIVTVVNGNRLRLYGAPFCLGPSEEDVQPEARRRMLGGEDADEQGAGALSIKTCERALIRSDGRLSRGGISEASSKIVWGA